MFVPLFQDLTVPPRLDILWRGTTDRRGPPVGIGSPVSLSERGLSLPFIESTSPNLELLGGRRDANLRGALQGSGPLRLNQHSDGV